MARCIFLKYTTFSSALAGVRMMTTVALDKNKGYNQLSKTMVDLKKTGERCRSSCALFSRLYASTLTHTHLSPFFI